MNVIYLGAHRKMFSRGGEQTKHFKKAMINTAFSQDFIFFDHTEVVLSVKIGQRQLL